MSHDAIRSRPFEYPASGEVHTGTLYQRGKGTERALIVVHGLFVNRRLPEIELLCERLATLFDVVSIDMRGHGDGPGPFTWGRREPGDIAELVSFLRQLYAAVGVAGFSLGGSIAILSAAMAGRGRDAGGCPDAVCTVGSPAHIDLWRFRLRPTGAMRHLGMILGRKRRRFRPGWPRLRFARAVEYVSGVAPVPLLIVHGERDWLVHPSHARKLYERAGPPRELLLLEEGLHAEYIIQQDPDLLTRPLAEFFGKWLEPSARSGDRRHEPGDPEVSLRRDRP